MERLLSLFSGNVVTNLDLSHIPSGNDLCLLVTSIGAKSETKKRLCEAFKFANGKGYLISHFTREGHHDSAGVIFPLDALFLHETGEIPDKSLHSSLEKRYGVKEQSIMWFVLGLRNIEVLLNPGMTKAEKEWYRLGLEIRNSMSTLKIDWENK